MPLYRICSSAPEGAPSALLEIACRDDLDALAAGEKLAAVSEVEVWDGERLVARVKLGNELLETEDPQSL